LPATGGWAAARDARQDGREADHDGWLWREVAHGGGLQREAERQRELDSMADGRSLRRRWRGWRRCQRSGARRPGWSRRATERKEAVSGPGAWQWIRRETDGKKK